jgi:hypothetical protein
MKVWLLPLLLLSLTACTDGNGERALRNYQQRLERVLDTEMPTDDVAAAAPLIAERDLKQPLPDLRLDLTDAYATRECNLDTLIGERNSSLGKVYSASKQLSYELRFLRQLELCLQQSWHDSALLMQLQQVYQQKQHSIVLAFDNMLLTDDTLRKELVGIRQALPVQNAPGFSETWQALTELMLLQQFIAEQNWPAASRVDIEQQLQILYQYNFLAKLQYSLRQSSQQLSQLNNMTQAIANSQLCPNGKQTEQLQILTTVFHKYFVQDVQLYTSELSRYQQQLWPLLQQLYQHTPLARPLQQRFNDNFQTMRSALTAHVNWWQSLNRQCPLQLTTRQ